MRSPKTRILDVELKTDFGKKACPEFISAMHRKLGQGEAYLSLRDEMESWVKFLNDTVFMSAIPFPETGGGCPICLIILKKRSRTLFLTSEPVSRSIYRVLDRESYV